MLIIIVSLVLLLSLSSCFKIDSTTSEVKISSNYYELKVNEELKLPIQINDLDVTYVSSNDDIVSINGNTITALKSGSTVIYAMSNNKSIKEYAIKVTGNEYKIKITGPSLVVLDEEAQFSATYLDEMIEVSWKSNDENILSIDEDGKALGVNEGLVTVEAISKTNPNIKGEISVFVVKEVSGGSATDTFVSSTDNMSSDLLTSVFYPIIEDAKAYTIEIKSYKKNDRNLEILDGTYCGVVYKRQYISSDGSITLDMQEDTVKYLYYALTNRHTVKDTTKVIVVDPETKVESNAKVLQYDLKVDLAIISFESNIYYKEAKFGDSDEAKSGEFVITVGSQMGSNYHSTAAIGIISNINRYLSDDTDGDGTNDWDSEYIQHDASINDGSDGSPLVNLKGEVIGLNTLKISSVKTEDMGFAIPINIIKDLIEPLEEGKQIVRPILGVSAIEVKTIIVSEYYKSQYPVDDEITFGIYIVEVGEGAAKEAGVQVNDILISINGMNIYYTYILRAELGKFVIDSGDTCEIVVYRNGEYITLTVTF